MFRMGLDRRKEERALSDEVWKPNRRFILKSAVASLAAVSFAPAFAVQSRAIAVSDELLEYDAVGLAQLIRDCDVSAREVLEASIARIEALDGQINALTTRNFAGALERVGQISPQTVFAGVPTLLKDLVDYGGVRRTSGSLLYLSNVPAASVDYVDAMESAGLSILGMTNTPEFASGALTDNLAFGQTHNPWDLGRNAGGSSGGSAAAVAMGYVPLAHGTDGGGSNRIPASCCGVLGMKASRYRQRSGEPDGSHYFLRTHQCLSRTVRDSAALLAATENPRNQANHPPVGLVEGPGKRRLRIAVSSENAFGEAPAPAVREVLQSTMNLCESLGHYVELVSNPISGEGLFQAAEGIMLAGMPGILALVESLTGRPAEEAGILTPATVNMGRYAARLPKDAQAKGVAYFAQLTADFAQFFHSYDVWLTPTIPVESPKLDYLARDTSFDVAFQRNRQLLGYTVAANGIGAPAMSVPLFHSSLTGLPVGSHFMAAPGADKTLYELAFELEAAQPWVGRRPSTLNNAALKRVA